MILFQFFILKFVLYIDQPEFKNKTHTHTPHHTYFSSRKQHTLTQLKVVTVVLFIFPSTPSKE